MRGTSSRPPPLSLSLSLHSSGRLMGRRRREGGRPGWREGEKREREGGERGMKEERRDRLGQMEGTCR